MTSAVLRGERLCAIARSAFCALLLLRFLSLPAINSAWAAALGLSLVGLALAFSQWALRQIRRGSATLGLVRASVLLDPLVCGLALFPNIIWPGHAENARLLTQPDMNAMLVVVVASGLRLNPILALQGGLAAAAVMAGLILAERQMRPYLYGYGSTQYSFYAVALIAATALAVLTAWRTRALAEAAARASRRIDGVREDLSSLVRDQHDARSLLSSALLQADLVDNALSRSLPGPTRSAEQLLRELRDDLRAASLLVRDLAENTFGQSMLLGEPEVVDVGAVLPDLLIALQLRVRPVIIHHDSAVGATTAVAVVGGRAALMRLIWNLIENAIQGDSVTSARQVWVSCREVDGFAILEIADDGPGFPVAVLAAVGAGCVSTKTRGLGLGLHGLARIVETSGGRWLCENRPEAGALVRIALPLAPGSEPPGLPAKQSAVRSPA